MLRHRRNLRTLLKSDSQLRHDLRGRPGRAIMSSKSKLGCAIDAAAFGAQLWSRLRARSILPPLHAGVGGQLEILLVSGQKKKTCLCFGERRSCVSGRRHRIDGGPPFKATAATLRVHIAPTGAGHGDFRVHLARSARPQGGSRSRESPARA